MTRGEGHRGRIPSRLHAGDTGLELMTLEIMTSAETKSWMINPLSHPGAPIHSNTFFGLGRFIH